MNIDRGLSGKDILTMLVAMVVLIAVILIVLTTALNGFLDRFSRSSLQAIAVLLVYAIALAFPLGILVGYAWCVARAHRLMLPPAQSRQPEASQTRPYLFEQNMPATMPPRLPDQPRLYNAAEEQRLMKIMEDLDA